MKIGILTFHRATNYGAVLQAFALKSFITQSGAEADIIDYRNDLIETLYRPKKLKEEKGFRGKVHFFLTYKREHKKNKKFEIFREKYLQIKADHYYTSNTIVDANNVFDKFVCGSDQVWNPKAHNFDKNFYLDFVTDDDKKFSYAASFGEIIEEKYYENLKIVLEKFSICSVREKQGCQIINNVSPKINTRIDIDPVFLLNKDGWEKAFNLSSNGKGKYVLVYLFRITNKTKELISILHKKGIKIIYIGKPLRNPFDCPVTFIPSADPVDFVKYFYSASFVITNSFHGTAFSIMFNKPFALELYTNTSRLENITELTSLQDRIYNDSTDFDIFLRKSINWDYVNERIDNLRNDSINYIKGEIINE